MEYQKNKRFMEKKKNQNGNKKYIRCLETNDNVMHDILYRIKLETYIDYNSRLGIKNSF
jgi:hypothetical protein